MQNGKWLLCYVLDSCFSLFICAPLVISAWRGLFQLQELLILPHHREASLWISTGTGVLINFPIFVFQHYLEAIGKQLRKEGQCKLLWLLFSRCFTLVYFFGTVSIWRGPWGLIDLYTGTGCASATLSIFVGILVSLGLRTMLHMAVPPQCLSTDVPQDYFICNIYFNTKIHPITRKFLLDCLFSCSIIEALPVLSFRGIWAMQDTMLYPHDAVKSSAAALGMGYCIMVPLFILQYKLGDFCSTQSVPGRVSTMHVFNIVAHVGCVCLWRGVWELQDALFLPDHKVLSNLVGFVVSIVALMILYVGNSVLVRGRMPDDEQPIIMPTDYINFFRKDESSPELENLSSNSDS